MVQLEHETDMDWVLRCNMLIKRICDYPADTDFTGFRVKSKGTSGRLGTITRYQVHSGVCGGENVLTSFLLSDTFLHRT